MNYNPDDFEFFNIKEAPFKIYGLFEPQKSERFMRMPCDAAKSVSANVAGGSYNTAGGRIRFKTDANRIVLRAKFPSIPLFTNLCMCNTNGFDLYKDCEVKEIFAGTFRPDNSITETNELNTMVGLHTQSEAQYTINFPLYGAVSDVEIGLPKGASLKSPDPYKTEKPIVFYGSSITQGAGASRPGLSYEAYVSRHLDCNYINLGFAGSALCEDAIIDYINSLDMTAFVFDYDHNAPNSEHLKNTHLEAFKKIRAGHPDMPIILMSKPDIDLFSTEMIKRRIIEQDTYRYAIEHGDKNVYYIDGYTLFEGEDRMDCTVDGCHPNDIGMRRMGKAVTNVLTLALYYR